MKDDNGLAILRDGLVISEDNLNILTKIINGEAKYKLPVVYVSKTVYNHDPVNIRWICSKLKGVAHFLVESDKCLNYRIRTACNDMNEYLSIHRKLFTGIYPHAGRIRDYNITKKEWVLNGATVLYGSATELRATLDYDFSEESKFSYRNLSMDEIIHHLAVFISRLWQIHVFGEGNTRTTAVFFIKYLLTLGFDVINDIFAENAWYFRNSLVRANYNDLKNGIHQTTEYL